MPPVPPAPPAPPAPPRPPPAPLPPVAPVPPRAVAAGLRIGDVVDGHRPVRQGRGVARGVLEEDLERVVALGQRPRVELVRPARRRLARRRIRELVLVVVRRVDVGTAPAVGVDDPRQAHDVVDDELDPVDPRAAVRRVDGHVPGAAHDAGPEERARGLPGDLRVRVVGHRELGAEEADEDWPPPWHVQPMAGRSQPSENVNPPGSGLASCTRVLDEDHGSPKSPREGQLRFHAQSPAAGGVVVVVWPDRCGPRRSCGSTCWERDRSDKGRRTLKNGGSQGSQTSSPPMPSPGVVVVNGMPVMTPMPREVRDVTPGPHS